MADDEEGGGFFDDLWSHIEREGFGGYVNERDARDAMRDEGYDDWLDAIRDGDIDTGIAAEMIAAGIEDPYGVTGVELEYDGHDWSLNFTMDNGDVVEVDLDSGTDIPEWVWDDLYEWADLFDWDWEVSYA